jgi:LysM repeat protein
MSRRDTIIIAVLLNAGLLIVLFATSLKSDQVATDEPSAITVLASNQSDIKEVAPSSKAAPATLPAPADQIDRVIEQYVTPQIASSESQNPSFLADMQPMGTLAPEPHATPEPIATPETSYKEVKVKKGDVLERIARQNHVSVSEIMKANQLTSTRLKIGQLLKIPGAGAAQASSSAQYYIVKAGDNPWTIAVKHHMKVDELLKLNNMDEQKARRLKAGDKIRIN